MESIADLIEAAKLRTGASYTEIGERLDRSKQLITNWKSGVKVPTDGDVMALARMAGENVDKWLAIAQAARTDGEAKARWEQIAKRLGAAAAMILCAIGFSLPVAGNAHATRDSHSWISDGDRDNAYYVKALSGGLGLVVVGSLNKCRIHGNFSRRFNCTCTAPARAC